MMLNLYGFNIFSQTRLKSWYIGHPVVIIVIILIIITTIIIIKIIIIIIIIIRSAFQKRLEPL